MNKDLIKQLDDSVEFIMLPGRHFKKVGNFVLGKSLNGRLEVLTFTEYINVERLKSMDTKSVLLRKKEQFLELYNQSEKFKKTIPVTEIDYYLQYDYETGSFTICEEVKGIFSYVLK